MENKVVVFTPDGYGDETSKCIEQIRKSNADYSVLSADHHIGYGVPIGGVIAHKNAINISGVGFDIGCGNSCVKLDISSKHLLTYRSDIADQIAKEISFGVGRNNLEKIDDPVFENPILKEVDKDIDRGLRQKAINQLGTVGSGNHYVDLFVDDEGFVWVGVHFGSRGLGHTIAKHYYTLAGAKDSMDADPVVLSMDTDIGKEYFKYMDLAGEYAYAGRNWVTRKVANILGAQILDTVHNHHNFAWEEEHFGEKYYVARKGATPAFPGQRGFVGSSMGEKSVILKGIDSDKSKEALYSTVHGAGRVMSRTTAAGKTRWKDGVKTVIKPGIISNEMLHNWVVKEANVELRGGGVDESPHCYKRLDKVLEAHAGTVEIENILTPIIVVMAGDTSKDFDPYKD